MNDKPKVYGPHPLANLKSGDVIAVVSDAKRTRDIVISKFVMPTVSATSFPVTYVEGVDHMFEARPLGIAVLSIDGYSAPLAKQVSSVVLRAYEMVSKDTGENWVFATVSKAKNTDCALVQVGRVQPHENP